MCGKQTRLFSPFLMSRCYRSSREALSLSLSSLVPRPRPLRPALSLGSLGTLLCGCICSPALEPVILDSNSPSSSRPLCLALNLSLSLSLLELSAFRLPAKKAAQSALHPPLLPSPLSSLLPPSYSNTRQHHQDFCLVHFHQHSFYQQHLRQTKLFNNVCRRRRRRQARRQEGRLQEGCWHQRLLRGKFLISTRLVFGAAS